MKKRLTAGLCLLLCALLIGLAGCGNAADKPDTSNQEEESVEKSRYDNRNESVNTGNGSVSSSETEKDGCLLPTEFFFGSYPQQNDDVQPIEWIVIDSDDESVLLLSRYCLASMPWHNIHEAVTWDESDIRSWLNDSFLNTAFSDAEREAILPVELANGDDLGYGTPVGEYTTDSVFLLSANEALDLLASDNRTTTPTAYAIQQGVYTNGSGNCAWWLRSPGMSVTSPAYFASGGEIGNRAHEVNETIIGIRPAVRVERSFLTAFDDEPEVMPEEAAALYDMIRRNDLAADIVENTELTATGIVTYMGTDIHGLPSFRLSDTADGTCYVHACLASSDEYGVIKVGDKIMVRGNFHIFSDEWGVVLKNSMVITSLDTAGTIEAIDVPSIAVNEKAAEKSIYTDANGDTAYIPAEFTVSEKEDEQTINTGLVVIGPDGSEFVWIPVSQTEFTQRDFGSYFSYGSSISSYRDETELPLYQEMIQSVDQYGGFYLGRYEASKGDGNLPASKRVTSDEPGTIWVCISPQDAVVACQNLYADNDTVQGFFPWGINWDTALQWLIDSGCKTENEVVGDSTSWGNYSNDTFSINADGQTTGQFEEAKANNIYDLAGNNWEWTQERSGSNFVMRGGGYNLMGGSCPGSDYPAAMRDPLPGNDHHPNAAFRVALFVK